MNGGRRQPKLLNNWRSLDAELYALWCERTVDGPSFPPTNVGYAGVRPALCVLSSDETVPVGGGAQKLPSSSGKRSLAGAGRPRKQPSSGWPPKHI